MVLVSQKAEVLIRAPLRFAEAVGTHDESGSYTGPYECVVPVRGIPRILLKSIIGLYLTTILAAGQ
jgi:hypothetical protein